MKSWFGGPYVLALSGPIGLISTLKSLAASRVLALLSELTSTVTSFKRGHA